MREQLLLPPPGETWKVVWTGRRFEAREGRPTSAAPNRYHREEVARSIASTLNACLLQR